MSPVVRVRGSQHDESHAEPELKVLLIALYSENYPAVGETYGLSVIAGAMTSHFDRAVRDLQVRDLVVSGSEDTSSIVALIAEMKPNVVGISVPYGTYDALVALGATIRGLLDSGVCVLIGGALPTYLSMRIHRDIDRRLPVVIGEGELASVGVVEAWLGRRPIEDVPNIEVYVGDVLIKTDRRLVPPDEIATPYRGHLEEVVKSGAQIFAESSRACSWAACSFCLRGLTDVAGKPREFRRLPINRLLSDLQQLSTRGISAITFADEDFLGGSLTEVSEFVDSLDLASQSVSFPSFDVSATIHSIFADDDSETSRSLKFKNLRSLTQIGLRKVFLGIESGSPTQLRRYCKGHTAKDCVGASEAVIRSGARLELGFIMFDPLCTLDEIAENVTFLLSNHLAEYVSGPTSELRLQSGSRYLPIIERHEGDLGRPLYNRALDPNTLSHEYDYMDPDVQQLVEAVRTENARSHPLMYRVKGLTRFGDGAILGDARDEVRRQLGEYRVRTLEALSMAARTSGTAYEPLARAALTDLAVGFLAEMKDGPVENPMVTQAVQVARQVLDN